MYIVPHDIMYLSRNCSVVEWQIRWVTRVSSLRFGCSGCARTLRFNMSHMCLLGFKSILCTGHWSVRRMFVTSITCVLLSALHGVLSFDNIVSRLKRIWGKRTSRMTSFGCHIAFMFPFLEYAQIVLCVNGSACAHSIMLIFAILNVFHTRQSTKNTFLPKNDNYIAVHEKPELFSQLPFSMDGFVHRTCIISVNW